MRRFLPPLVPVLTLAACATSRAAAGSGERRLVPADAPRQAWEAPSQDSPDAPATVAYSATQCEREARGAFVSGDREWGWKALVACSRRADFLSLRLLLHDPWKEEIGKHGEEGARLLARILMRTNLELGYDLPRIQNAGIPLLDLRQVADDPALAEGQYVLLRGIVGSREKAAAGGELIAINEQRQIGVYEGKGRGEEGQGGGGAFSPAQVSRMGGPATLAYGGNGYLGMPLGGSSPLGRGMRGGMIGPGRPYAGWPNGAPYNNDYYAIGPVYENQSIDTGRKAMLDLARFDPRLTPGMEVAVLARVKGVAQMHETNDVCKSSDHGKKVTCATQMVASRPMPKLDLVRIWILSTNEEKE